MRRPVGSSDMTVLGRPRVHLRRTASTNERARELALAGAPHGTLVSAAEQTAGRGRQGRVWTTPAGSALLCSLVLRWAASDRPPPLLSLTAGVAVCDAVGARARLKWPNDVVVVGQSGNARQDGDTHSGNAHWDEDARRGEQARQGGDARRGAQHAGALAKLAGILVEGRPQEGWAVLGIGLNVAVRVSELPADVRERAASLNLPPSAIEPMMERLLLALARRLAQPAETTLEAWRARDALCGREVSWGSPPSLPEHGSAQTGRGRAGHIGTGHAQVGSAQVGSAQADSAQAGHGRAGRGQASGIDDAGRLLVKLEDGSTTALDAGEVHLEHSRRAGSDPGP